MIDPAGLSTTVTPSTPEKQDLDPWDRTTFSNYWLRS